MPHPATDNHHEVWVVTGAASGMGLQLCRELQNAGATVHAWDIAPPVPDILHYRRVDLLDALAIAESTHLVEGPVYCFAHCAGAQFAAVATDPSAPAKLEQAFSLHCLAFLRCVQGLLPHLQAARGSAVAITSIADHLVYPSNVAYGPSKAALTRLVRQLAVELGPEVRVNGVAPGPIRTPLTETIWADPGKARARIAQIPVRRPGEPGDVAEAVRFLAAATFLTGVILPVDGGFEAALAFGQPTA